MRSKALTVLSIATAALGVAACGSKKKSTSSSSSAPASSSASTPTATTAKKKKKKKTTGIPSRTYRLKLTGKGEVPPGAPKGTGSAVVSFHGKSLKVCWRFSHLHGFTGATFAHIHKGAAGTSGPIVIPLSTGPKLKHSGCVTSTATLIKAIEKNPKGYYVNIHSKKYPGGAVRSQL